MSLSTECTYQGVTAGWADIYYRDLDCQWVDITDVPEGPYILDVHVNPERIVEEVNYTNNFGSADVFIPAAD